jgi:hypothetical protein
MEGQKIWVLYTNLKKLWTDHLHKTTMVGFTTDKYKFHTTTMVKYIKIKNKKLKNMVNKHFITQVWQIYLALCYKLTCFNIWSNRERRPVFLPTLVCSHNLALSSSEELFCFLFFLLCWTLCDMVSCFREGAMPSSTNTGLAPNSKRHDVRKKRFLESVLLLENKNIGVSCIK